jgi:hypothetical protein
MEQNNSGLFKKIELRCPSEEHVYKPCKLWWNQKKKLKKIKISVILLFGLKI